MQVAKIKLRMPHDGKVLGIDLDASLNEIEVTVEHGVMTMSAGPRVWDAIRRLSGGLVRRTKKPEEVVYVDPVADTAARLARRAARTREVEAPAEDAFTPAVSAE